MATLKQRELTAEQLKADNAEALAIVEAAESESRPLTATERAKVVELYHGAGGTVGLTHEEFNKGIRRQETQQQYFTPTWMGRLMYDLLGAPTDALFFDPAVGTGRMFYDFADKIFLTGIEKDKEVWRIGHALFGMAPYAGRWHLINDDMKMHHYEGIADYCLGNPPFNIALADARGIVPEEFKSAARRTIRSDGLYLWSIIEALRFGGIAAVIVPPAVLTEVPNFLRFWREQVDTLAVVTLPAGKITEKSWNYDTVVYLIQKKRLPEAWAKPFLKMRRTVLEKNGVNFEKDSYNARYGVRYDSEKDISEIVRAAWPKEAERPSPQEVSILKSFSAESFASKFPTSDSFQHTFVGKKTYEEQFKRATINVTFDGDAEAVKKAVMAAFGNRIATYRDSLEPRQRPILIEPQAALSPKIQALIDEAEALTDLPSAPPMTVSGIDLKQTPPPPPKPGARHLSMALLAQEGRATGGAITVPDSIETAALLTFMQLVGVESNPGISGNTGTANHRNAFRDMGKNFLLYQPTVLDTLNTHGVRPLFSRDDMERIHDFKRWEARQLAPFTRRKRKKLPNGEYGEFTDVPTPITEQFKDEIARNMAAVAGLTTQSYKLLTPSQFISSFWDAADLAGADAFIDTAAERLQAAIVAGGSKKKDAKIPGGNSGIHVLVLPKGDSAKIMSAIAAGGWPHKLEKTPTRDSSGNIVQRDIVLLRSDDRAAIADAIKPLTVDAFRLYNYQASDLGEMLLKDRILNSYQMGLGKTRSSIAYARAMRVLDQNFRRTLIVCPAFLVDEWMLEMRELGIPESEVGVLRLEDARYSLPSGAWGFDFSKWTLKPFNILSMTELVPKDKVKPEIGENGEFTGRPLHRFDESSGKKAKDFREGVVVKKKIKGHPPYVSEPRDVREGDPLGEWVPEYFSLPEIEWPTSWLDANGAIDLVIVDEAYKMKETKTDVYKGLSRLNPRKRMLLTGTPIKSIPSEGWSLFSWLLEGTPGPMNEFGKENGGLRGYNDVFGTFVAKLKEYKDKDGDIHLKPEISNQASPAFSNVEYFQRMIATFMKRRLRAETLIKAPAAREALEKAKAEGRWPNQMTEAEKQLIGPMWDVPQVADPEITPVPIVMDFATEKFYLELCQKFIKDFREWVADKKAGKVSDFNFQGEMGKILRALTTPQAKQNACSDMEVAAAHVALQRLKEGWIPKKLAPGSAGMLPDESDESDDDDGAEVESSGEAAGGEVAEISPEVLEAIAKLGEAQRALEKAKESGEDKKKIKALTAAVEEAKRNSLAVERAKRVEAVKAKAEGVIARAAGSKNFCGNSSLQEFLITSVKQALSERGEDGKPRKVVLFVQDKKALLYYEAAFITSQIPTIVVSGQDSLKPLKTTGISPRRVKIDTFRFREGNNLMVATIDSMAEGVNLPEASVGFFDHWDWTPSKMKQAAFRMVRPSQRNKVKIKIPYFKHSVWEYAKFLNGYKAVSIEAAFDGDPEDIEGTNSLLKFKDFIEAVVNGRQAEFFDQLLKQTEKANKTPGIDEESVSFTEPPAAGEGGAGGALVGGALVNPVVPPTQAALRYAYTLQDSNVQEFALALRDWYDGGRSGRMPSPYTFKIRGPSFQIAEGVERRMKAIYGGVPAAPKTTPAAPKSTPAETAKTPAEPPVPAAPAEPEFVPPKVIPASEAPAPKRRHKAETDLERWTINGLRLLASNDPDNAALINDVGFSKFDGAFGKSLIANHDAYGLTDDQWREAKELAHKYRRQISGQFGDEPADTPAPPPAAPPAAPPVTSAPSKPKALPSKISFARSAPSDPGFPDAYLLSADAELEPGSMVEVTLASGKTKMRRVGRFVKNRGAFWYYVDGGK